MPGVVSQRRARGAAARIPCTCCYSALLKLQNNSLRQDQERKTIGTRERRRVRERRWERDRREEGLESQSRGGGETDKRVGGSERPEVGERDRRKGGRDRPEVGERRTEGKAGEVERDLRWEKDNESWRGGRREQIGRVLTHSSSAGRRENPVLQ